MMRIMTVMVLAICLAAQALFAQAEPVPTTEQTTKNIYVPPKFVQVGEKLTIEQIAKQISNQPNDETTLKIIDKASLRLQMEEYPSIEAEIALLTSVEKYELGQKGELKRTYALMDILNYMYKDDPEGLMKLFLHEIVFYRQVAPNKEKLAEVIAQITLLSNQVRNRQAISYMTQQIEIGESYRALPGGEKPGEMQTKAREYYNKALISPIYDWNDPSMEKHQQLYIRAAIDLIEITDGDELAKLRFHPYAWERIYRVYPDKAKLISNSIPGLDNVKNMTALWLGASLQKTDKDSEIHKQIVAVLEYLKTREY